MKPLLPSGEDCMNPQEPETNSSQPASHASGQVFYVHETRYGRWWAECKSARPDVGHVTQAEMRTIMRADSEIGGWGYFDAFWLDHLWIRLLRLVGVLVWLAGLAGPFVVEWAGVTFNLGLSGGMLAMLCIAWWLVWLCAAFVVYPYLQAKVTLVTMLGNLGLLFVGGLLLAFIGFVLNWLPKETLVWIFMAFLVLTFAGRMVVDSLNEYRPGHHHPPMCRCRFCWGPYDICGPVGSSLWNGHRDAPSHTRDLTRSPTVAPGEVAWSLCGRRIRDAEPTGQDEGVGASSWHGGHCRTCNAISTHRLVPLFSREWWRLRAWSRRHGYGWLSGLGPDAPSQKPRQDIF